MTLRDYHIFISHSWDYSDHYQTIVDWLDSAPYFTWKNYSIPIEKQLDASSKRQLEEKLDVQISCSSCVIILSGMYSTYSEWINFEIQTALKYGKPIIGVKPWGQQKIPLAVSSVASKMVGWNSASVVNAIRDYAL